MLCHPVASGGNPQLHPAVLAGSHVLAVIAVNGLQQKNGAGNLRAGTLFNFGNPQKGLLLILENQLFFVACIQRDCLRRFVADHIRLRHRFLRHAVAAGHNAQGNGTVCLGGDILAVVTVNGFYSKHGSRNFDTGTLFHLGDFQCGLFEVVKNQFLAVAGLQPDGLGGFVADHIRVRNRNFCHLIAVGRNPGQCGSTIRAGGHIVVVAIMNSADLKVGVGNHITRFGISLQNSQIGQFLVRRRHSDCAAAVDGCLIDMSNDRFGKSGIGSWSGHLHEGIHTLGDVRDGDGAILLGGLSADQLAVPEDVEHAAGKGIVAVVQLQEPDFYLAVVFKHKINVVLPVPVEALLDLALIGAFRVALRRGYFLCDIASNGHRIPRHIGQPAAFASDVGSCEAVVYSCDLNNSSGEALGGIVCVHLPNVSLAGDFRRVREGDGHSSIAVAGQDNILGTGVVNLIPVRRFRFRNSVGTRIQIFQRDGAVRPSGNVLVEGAISGRNMKLRPSKALGGICGIHLFNNQLIGNTDNFQLTNDDFLDIAARAARIGVFLNGAVAPCALRTEIEDVLRPLTEGIVALLRLVNAGETGAFQGVVDVHQLLGARLHRVAAQCSGFITPDDGLHPGVHIPGVSSVPDIIYTCGNSDVRKFAKRMAVIIRHHHGNGGIGDAAGVVPGVAPVIVIH